MVIEFHCRCWLKSRSYLFNKLRTDGGGFVSLAQTYFFCICRVMKANEIEVKAKQRYPKVPLLSYNRNVGNSLSGRCRYGKDVLLILYFFVFFHLFFCCSYLFIFLLYFSLSQELLLHYKYIIIIIKNSYHAFYLVLYFFASFFERYSRRKQGVRVDRIST